MTKKRTIKKESTKVARKRVAPVRKKKKTPDKIKKWTRKTKMLGSAGSLGMVLGGRGKLIKKVTSIAKHHLKKRAAKKIDKRAGKRK